MFQLNKEEFENWKSQFATSNSDESLRSQFATSTEEENWKSQIAISIPTENMSPQIATTSDEFLRSQIAMLNDDSISSQNARTFSSFDGLRSQIVTLDDDSGNLRSQFVMSNLQLPCFQTFLPISPIANRVTSSIVPDVIRRPPSISPALDAGFVR